MLNSTQQPREGMVTPWGNADHVREMAPGIWLVCTPSHGGIWIDDAHRFKMPRGFQHRWFEEDCEWSIPFVRFADELASDKAVTTGEHIRTCKEWEPDAYTAITGQPVTAEESHVIRERVVLDRLSKGEAAIELKPVQGYGFRPTDNTLYHALSAKYCASWITPAQVDALAAAGNRITFVQEAA